jgi:DNA polymerase-1
MQEITLEQALIELDNFQELALDTETTGDFDNLYSRSVIMLQLGDHKSQIIVDCRKTSPLPLLKKLLDNNTLVYAHNVKFDYTVIKIDYGLELENVFDTMLVSQLVDYELDKEKGSFSLESCVRRHVDPSAYSNQLNLFSPAYTKDLRKTFSSIKDEDDFTPSQLYYGGADVAFTYALGKRLKIIAEEQGVVGGVEQENQFVKVLADMEINGVFTDRDLFLEASKEAYKRADELGEDLKRHYDINWDSPKQVAKVLKELGVDVLIIDKKSGEIKESVGKIVIEKQAARFPILKEYIEYKLADKKRKAYGEKFLRHVNPVDGRIHTSFLQLMSTGRTSSSGPNMQNIPRDAAYRKAFRPEEGNVFVAADFSSQEMRVLADFSGDKNMIKAVSAGDVHLETARIMYDNPHLTKESEERQYAKSTNFLIA